jgi:hypothetical protein
MIPSANWRRVIILVLAFCALTSVQQILAQVPVTPGQVKEAIDVAAAQSDRWLFLAAIVVLLLFCASVIHWCMNQLDKQRLLNTELQGELTKYLRESNADLVAAIKLNSKIMEENSGTNLRVAEALKELNHTFEK